MIFTFGPTGIAKMIWTCSGNIGPLKIAFAGKLDAIELDVIRRLPPLEKTDLQYCSS